MNSHEISWTEDAACLTLAPLISPGERFVDIGTSDRYSRFFAQCCGAQVYGSAQEVDGESNKLSSLDSIALLRLESPSDLDDEVKRAIDTHHPDLLLGPVRHKDFSRIVGQAVGWGYQPVASIGDLLFLARRHDCVPVAIPGDGQGNGHTSLHSLFSGAKEARQSLRSLVDRSTTRLRNRTDLLTLLRAYRPRSVKGRKFKKLVTDPEGFLRDSGAPLLNSYGANLAARLVPRHPEHSSSTKVTVHTFPKRTILVCLGSRSMASLEQLTTFVADLDLATEVVIVADGKHAGILSALIERDLCPRMRIYLFDGAVPGETLLRYGVSRGYARNVAIVAAPELRSIEDVVLAFARLTDEVPVVIDDELLVTRRYLLNEGEGEGESASQVAATRARIVKQLDCRTSTNLELPPASDRVFVYKSVSPFEPFEAQAHPRVTCLETRPRWTPPPSEAARGQGARVSVIMTVFNAEDVVEQAVRSVLEQSYKNLELLVVDDCSSDESLSLLRELAQNDDRMRVLQTATNSGTYFAKNVGLRFAIGDYVSFHDSDDISAGNRIEGQVEALDTDSEAIGNYTRYQRISNEGDEIWFSGKTNRPGYITLMFRRKQVLEAIGFFDSVRVAADTEFVNRLRSVTGRPVTLLPTVSYFALQAEGSLTTAGAGAFSVGTDGRVTLPPSRQVYHDNATAYHASISTGHSSPIMPFPLGTRAFFAPPEIRPDRGGADMTQRLVNSAKSAFPEQLQTTMLAVLAELSPHHLEASSIGALRALQETRHARAVRELFLATLETLGEAGRRFGDQVIDEFPDPIVARRLARLHAEDGGIRRPLELLDSYVPQDMTTAFYLRLSAESRMYESGVEADCPPAKIKKIKPLPIERTVLYHVSQSIPFHEAGYSIRTQYLLSSLARLGWGMTAATRFGYPSDRSDYVVTTEVPKEATIDGVRYCWSPDTTGIRGMNATEQHLLLCKNLLSTCQRTRPALIHSASNHIIGLAGARVARQLGIPSVYEIRGLWHMTRASRHPSYLDSEHYRLIEKLEVQAALESDHVFALTGAMRDLLVAAGVESDRVSLLPNAVDAERFHPTEPDEALQASLDTKGKLVIGFIGTINHYEGLDLLLDAFSRVDNSDAQLLLVGDGSAKDELVSQAKQLGLEQRVLFTGKVSHDEVSRYYSLLDVAVYPRKALRVCEYVSPLKPFEALSQGKAVIVSSVAALAESVDEGVTGLVFEKGNVEELRVCLENTLGDSTLRMELGKQARERVLRGHTWVRIAQQVDQVYTRLLAKR